MWFWYVDDLPVHYPFNVPQPRYQKSSPNEDEFNEGKINPRYRELGAKRADIVIAKFGDFGIDASRLVADSREDLDPASTRDTDISRAQNRRVTFEIIQ